MNYADLRGRIDKALFHIVSIHDEYELDRLLEISKSDETVNYLCEESERFRHTVTDTYLRDRLRTLAAAWKDGEDVRFVVGHRIPGTRRYKFVKTALMTSDEFDLTDATRGMEIDRAKRSRKAHTKRQKYAKSRKGRRRVA